MGAESAWKGKVSQAAYNAKETVMVEVRETKEAVKEVWRFVRTHNWKSTAKIAFRRKYWGWWLLLAVTTALGAVLSSYHTQIVTAINPYKHKIRHAPAVWLVPVIVLVIISFPPLIGHELVILVVGMVWGLAWGFVIACAGTFLGEIACFYAFRYWFTSRAKKIEAKQVAYSCLARMMREGGVGLVCLVRFSAVPGHVTTAIQSTVGMSIWIYAIAAIVSLPKQFALVYLGVVFGSSSITLKEWQKLHTDGTPISQYYNGESTKAQRHRVSLIVFAATTFATLIAGWIVWMRIRRIRPFVIADMAKAAALKAARKEDIEDGGAEETSEVTHTPVEVQQPVSGSGVLASRPTFVRDNSTYGSQIALLSAGSFQGRLRSDTMETSWTTSSGLNSPSLPHLPLADEERDYFGLETEELASPPVVGGRPRALSNLRRGSV